MATNFREEIRNRMGAGSDCDLALLIVNDRLSQSPKDLPDLQRVNQVMRTALNESGWGEPDSTIKNIREDLVAIQDEVPPADPVTARAIVMTLHQMPINHPRISPRARSGRLVTDQSPLIPMVNAVYDELDNAEVWIDGVVSRSM